MHTMYKKFADLMKANGFELVRNTKGSHCHWKAPDRPVISVTNKLNDRNLANRLLKIAGIEQKL